MRITNSEQIKTLGKHAQKQIRQHLSISTKAKSKNLKYCEFPSTNPAVWLHIALEKMYKHVDRGGVFVQELILPFTEKEYRYDFAVLDAKIMIEFDGFASHSKKDIFKNDRKKQMLCLTQGWVMVNVSNQMVREDLNSVVQDIEKIRLLRQRYKIPKIGKKGRCFHVYENESLPVGD